MINMKVKYPDVLVVGAGPAGVALAIGLKRKGLDVMLVEKQSAPQKAFKGEYLQPSATALLESMNLNQVFEQSSCSFIRELRFRDLDSNDQVISELMMPYPSGTRATAISHYDLIKSLRSHAEIELKDSFITGVQLKHENPGFAEDPIFSYQQSDGQTIQVAARWVVGADGRNSYIRKLTGGKSIPVNAPVTLGSGPELIVGGEINTAPPAPQRYEVMRFFEKGTVSSFSLGDQGQRIYFSYPDTGSKMNKDAKVQLQNMVQRCKSQVDLGDIDDKSPIHAFPAYGAWFGGIHRRNIILMGDAAGATSPYGGQGITAAFEHVEYLLEQFNFSESAASALGKVQIKQYGRFIKNVYNRISLLNFGLYYLFFSRVPVFKSISSYILSVWNENHEMKTRVIRLFAGLDKDQPSAAELLRLWGVTRFSPRHLRHIRQLTLRGGS